MEKIALAELPGVAQRLLASLPPKVEGATVVALEGDLGAGKTTFVQALARELGVAGPVQSPTYVLMRSYPVPRGRFRTLVHIDAYRLESSAQFAALAPERFLHDVGTLVCIEWPGRVEGALPTPDIVIRFSSQDTGEDERHYDIS